MRRSRSVRSAENIPVMCEPRPERPGGIRGRELDHTTGERPVPEKQMPLPWISARQLTYIRTCCLSFNFVQSRKGTQGGPKIISRYIQRESLVIGSELKQMTGVVDVASKTLVLHSKSYSTN